MSRRALTALRSGCLNTPVIGLCLGELCLREDDREPAFEIGRCGDMRQIGAIAKGEEHPDIALSGVTSFSLQARRIFVMRGFSRKNKSGNHADIVMPKALKKGVSYHDEPPCWCSGLSHVVQYA